MRSINHPPFHSRPLLYYQHLATLWSKLKTQMFWLDPLKSIEVFRVWPPSWGMSPSSGIYRKRQQSHEILKPFSGWEISRLDQGLVTNLVHWSNWCTRTYRPRFLMVQWKMVVSPIYDRFLSFRVRSNLITKNFPKAARLSQISCRAEYL